MEIALVEQPGKIMKIPNLSIQQLLEAGVHLGHKTLRWNPKMKKYIFGKRDSIHIIDLTQTLELTNVALEKVYNTILNNTIKKYKFSRININIHKNTGFPILYFF